MMFHRGTNTECFLKYQLYCLLHGPVDEFSQGRWSDVFSTLHPAESDRLPVSPSLLIALQPYPDPVCCFKLNNFLWNMFPEWVWELFRCDMWTLEKLLTNKSGDLWDNSEFFFFQGAESSSPRNSDTASEFDSILSFGVNRKDTTLSSASSGVSSGSPLSHSPAASQSSNSSMSPRQQSPVGWQHGSENGFNINLKFLEDDGNVPLPPPGLTNTKQIWGLHHGNEVHYTKPAELTITIFNVVATVRCGHFLGKVE